LLTSEKKKNKKLGRVFMKSVIHLPAKTKKTTPQDYILEKPSKMKIKQFLSGEVGMKNSFFKDELCQ